MKILFAVSDRDLLHSYSRLLELDGADVCTSFDGTQTITLIESHKFDVAVIGESLPRVENSRILGMLYGKGVPTIVISGKRVTSKMLCGSQIACSYLPVPFLPEEMRSLIKTLLEKKQSGKVFRTGEVSIDTSCFSMEGVRVTNEEIDVLRAVCEDTPINVRSESVYISALNSKLGSLNKHSRIKYILGKGYRLVNNNG